MLDLRVGVRLAEKDQMMVPDIVPGHIDGSFHGDVRLPCTQQPGEQKYGLGGAEIGVVAILI